MLSKWTSVVWVDRDPNHPERLSYFGEDPTKPNPHGLIKIVRRTELVPGAILSLIKILSALLHEMAHAVLRIYTCLCRCRGRTLGVTGHGPSWVKLVEAIEKELERSFGGRDKWAFYIIDSLRNEISRIEKLGRQAGLGQRENYAKHGS